MIDQVHILIQAGHGGNGCESYNRRPDRKAVPHGGYGGKGGNIIFKAVEDAPSIAQYRTRRHLIAESGAHGGSNRKSGKNGTDMICLVPVGTRLFNRSKDLLIREQMKAGEEVVVVEGGQGGTGNQGGKEATPGEKGESMDLEISVFLIADVCLVGLPNSGKSSLLNTLTRAHAKVEEYPFTTRTPELAVCDFIEFEQLKICELPALYAASHEGNGLGNHFLKHLELANHVIYVLDPVSEFADSLAAGFDVLYDQIGRFEKRFAKMPSAVIVNKMDVQGAREKVEAEGWKSKVPVFYVSAHTGEGMDALKKFMEGLLEKENERL